MNTYHEEMLMYAETARVASKEAEMYMQCMARQSEQDKRTIQGYRAMLMSTYKAKHPKTPNYVSRVEEDLKAGVERIHTLLDRAQGMYPGTNIHEAYKVAAQMVQRYGLKTEPRIQQRDTVKQRIPGDQGITHPQLQGQNASGEVVEASKKALRDDRRKMPAQPQVYYPHGSQTPTRQRGVDKRESSQDR